MANSNSIIHTNTVPINIINKLFQNKNHASICILHTLLQEFYIHNLLSSLKTSAPSGGEALKHSSLLLNVDSWTFML